MRDVIALYNEIESFAADWLENLVKENRIASGQVDRRSIAELEPADLAGCRQAHFFAGIGGWSHALRLAGWPDDRPVWTGSCPCQPFSAAGKRGGFADARHLWPEWFRLICECRPAIIFGEQVASPPGRAWLDLVSADLEGVGYAIGAADLAAAGVGAPHKRQRIYFVAIADRQRRDGIDALLRPEENRRIGAPALFEIAGRGAVGESDRHGTTRQLVDAEMLGRERDTQIRRQEGRRIELAGELGNASGTRGGRYAGAVSGAQGEGAGEWRAAGGVADELEPTGATFWDAAEWIECRDGKRRPVEPGTFPLAHGVPNRVGRLRGYGNAIVPPLAATFIRSVLDIIGE